MEIMKIFKNIKEYKNITKHYTFTDIGMFLVILFFTYSTSKLVNGYISIIYFVVSTITLLHLVTYSFNNYYKRNFFDLYFFFKRILKKKKKLLINQENMDFLLLDSSYLFGLTFEDKNKLIYNLQSFFENLSLHIEQSKNNPSTIWLGVQKQGKHIANIEIDLLDYLSLPNLRKLEELSSDE